jgi:hypothetical protein
MSREDSAELLAILIVVLLFVFVGGLLHLFISESAVSETEMEPDWSDEGNAAIDYVYSPVALSTMGIGLVVLILLIFRARKQF